MSQLMQQREPRGGDLSRIPYWWNTVARPLIPTIPVPRRVDAAIVGGGVAGLTAAATLRAAGASVVVLDRGVVGDGAASRNLGFLVERIDGFLAGTVTP